jgi:hypothetical protein
MSRSTSSFPKIPKRFGGLVMPLVLSCLMTAIVSAISIARTQGLDAHALQMWPSAWGLSWLVAFPVLLVILPVVRRITGLLVAS